MITTLDGKRLTRGQRAWEIGVTLIGKYIPTMGVVHGGSNRIINEDRCWLDYKKCLAKCRKMNREAKKLNSQKK